MTPGAEPSVREKREAEKKESARQRAEYEAEFDKYNPELIPLREKFWAEWRKAHPWARRNSDEREFILRARCPVDPLTDEERPMLLELPNLEAPVLGKALAYPDSLTEEEKIEVLLWPADPIRRANVSKVTGGSLSLEEFLDRAASDVGFLTFDRIMFVLNDYNIPPQDPDWIWEKTLEREEAQALVMPDLEKKVFENAGAALQGAGLASQMQKLLAGELSVKDAEEERRKFAIYRARYDELVWKMEVLKDDATFKRRGNVKCEEDLYLLYFSKEASEKVQELIAENKNIGFVFYPTAELRNVHIDAAERFRQDPGPAFARNPEFNLRLAINHALLEGNEEEAARLRQQGLRGLSFWPSKEFSVPFEFYFGEYLRFILVPSKDDLPGRIMGHGYAAEEKALVRLIRHQIADFEASETDLRSFRQHFRQLREDSLLEPGSDARYFILCSSDVTPDVCKAGASSTKRQVWVIDADWEAPPGKDSDEDGYQGRLKCWFRRALFTRLTIRIRKDEFNLKEAWIEMKEHGWECRY